MNTAPSARSSRASAGELSELVRTANATASFRWLAKRSVDPETGLTVSYQYLNNLAHDDRGSKTPSLPELRALAAGLGVAFEEVRAKAVAQYLDLRPETWSVPSDVREIVALLTGLTPAERAMWRRMIVASRQGEELPKHKESWRTEPHRVYLVRFPALGVLKVGITHDRDDRRLHDHLDRGAELVQVVALPDRASAQALERAVLARVRPSVRTAVGPEELPQGGCTEAWLEREAPPVDLEAVRAGLTTGPAAPAQ